MHVSKAKDWHINIDKYLRPYIPRNLVHKLPRPLSHFLGHRDRAGARIGNVLVAAWALLGAFVGVAVIEAAFMAPAIKDHGVPLLIASFVRLGERFLQVNSTLKYTGCCSDIGVQHRRITARPASKRYCRTRPICHRWHWHHQTLQAQRRLQQYTLACRRPGVRSRLGCYDSHRDCVPSGRSHSFAGCRRSAGGASWMVLTATRPTQYGFDVDDFASDQQYSTTISYILVDRCGCWKSIKGG